MDIIEKRQLKKIAIIQDAMRWMAGNIPNSISNETKKSYLTNYICSKYILSEKTGKEYASIILNRLKMNIPDSLKTDSEIIRDRGGYDAAYTHTGDVPIVDEDIPEVD